MGSLKVVFGKERLKWVKSDVLTSRQRGEGFVHILQCFEKQTNKGSLDHVS
jgi:hypothetical protein